MMVQQDTWTHTRTTCMNRFILKWTHDLRELAANDHVSVYIGFSLRQEQISQDFCMSHVQIVSLQLTLTAPGLECLDFMTLWEYFGMGTLVVCRKMFSNKGCSAVTPNCVTPPAV